MLRNIHEHVTYLVFLVEDVFQRTNQFRKADIRKASASREHPTGAISKSMHTLSNARDLLGNVQSC